MRTPASLLHVHVHVHVHAADDLQAAAAAPAPPSPPASADQQQPAVDSDMVVILASFLCALVCVLGLALVSRCACRRFSPSSDHPTQQPTSPPPHPPPPRGLKKKAIDALPTVSFAAASPSEECAICLADFAEGEAVRVLPRCGHGFHVACVDAWLRTRATCPSCRAAIVVTPAGACGRCGQVLPPPPPTPGPGQPHPSAAGAGAGVDDTFLP
ncbi:hypothetical protein U9M48_026101 [Paspalum notatum var. saurae]|uniref:RING-type domain-containing protein n=1 Tax=Paspalum notatum var. saurae TaxID=547442 RepID=A0AAQ3TS61_PASNO